MVVTRSVVLLVVLVGAGCTQGKQAIALGAACNMDSQCPAGNACLAGHCTPLADTSGSTLKITGATLTQSGLATNLLVSGVGFPSDTSVGLYSGASGQMWRLTVSSASATSLSAPLTADASTAINDALANGPLALTVFASAQSAADLHDLTLLRGPKGDNGAAGDKGADGDPLGAGAATVLNGTYLQLTGGTVTGDTTFSTTVTVDQLIVASPGARNLFVHPFSFRGASVGGSSSTAVDWPRTHYGADTTNGPFYYIVSGSTSQETIAPIDLPDGARLSGAKCQCVNSYNAGTGPPFDMHVYRMTGTATGMVRIDCGSTPCPGSGNWTLQSVPLTLSPACMSAAVSNDYAARSNFVVHVESFDSSSKHAIYGCSATYTPSPSLP
jgi:hypothetical protein